MKHSLNKAKWMVLLFVFIFLVNIRFPLQEVRAQEDDLTGWLYFIVDDDLYEQNLAKDSEPQLILEDIIPETISVAPTQDRMIYSGPEALHFQRIGTEPWITYGSLAGLQLDIWNWSRWSADGKWIVLNINAPQSPNSNQKYSYLLRTEGGQDGIVIEQSRRYREWQLWRQDNQLLVATVSDQRTTGEDMEEIRFPTIISIYSLDPETGQQTNFKQKIPEFSNEAEFIEFLLEHDQMLAEPFIIQPYSATSLNAIGYFPFMVNAPLIYFNPPSIDFEQFASDINPYCTEWKLMEMGATDEHIQTEIASFEDVAGLSHLQVNAQGKIAFLRWSFPECTMTGVVVEVVLGDNTGHFITIADQLAIPDNDTSRGLNVDNLDFTRNIPPRFAISPDGNFVAWIHGMNANLYLTDVATLEEVEFPLPVEFQGKVSAVYWLHE